MTQEQASGQPRVEGVRSPEEVERVRGYLASQTAKYDWHELWPRVTRARVDLLDALVGVSDAQAAWQPSQAVEGQGEEVWSIREIAQHVEMFSRSTLAQVEAMVRGEPVPERPPSGTTKDEPDRSIDDLRRALIDHSVAFASLIERLPAEPNEETTYAHAFFGELNSRSWYLFQRLHDADHIGQIEAVKATPGYPEA